MAGGEIGAGVKLGRRQNAAVRSGMAVIFRATADTGSPAGRRAPGKRSIGTVRAAGVQMPSGAGQPSRHHGHVGKDGRRRRAGADPGIGECRHVQFSPNASPAASRSPARGFRPRPAGLFLQRRAGATPAGLIRGPARAWVGHGRSGIHRAPRVLAAGAAVAAGRGHGDGGGAVRAGARVAGDWWHGAGDAADDGGIAGLVAPCGLPLALGCRRLWRLGYRRGVWRAGIVLGAVTVAASLVAGMPGPVAIALYAAGLSLPAWIAWRWLARRG